MGARMAQWRGRSPPTNVSRVSRVPLPDPVSYVAVEFVFGSLLSGELREVFLPVHRFFPLLKPTFQNSNSILECTDISERVLLNSLVPVFRW